MSVQTFQYENPLFSHTLGKPEAAYWAKSSFQQVCQQIKKKSRVNANVINCVQQRLCRHQLDKDWMSESKDSKLDMKMKSDAMFQWSNWQNNSELNSELIHVEY